MSNTTTDFDALNKTIALYEHQRCQALVNNDMDALGKLIAHDLVHVHANGLVENRAAYLKTVSEHLDFITVKRASLEISVTSAANDVAVATGELLQTIRVKASGLQIDMRIMTTQVWTRNAVESEWRQSLFQATNIA